ncbi:two-component response regulator [Calothrix parasitica NIES-267]|uniref:Two-component response regulator n=1 Tax=Calothrix parasitica NIES-267 TaxID=1973488 RepID=A0A1Z4LLV2_9CYAN|nr:two-component response regulator [Calothrix parasitica NIES-267]
MQNNQPSLQKYFFYDLNDQYKSEDYSETEARSPFEDLSDDDDYFSQSYAELDVQNNGLDNPALNQSQPYTNSNYHNESSENGNNFLNTAINYASYDEDDYSQDEDNEIHYLNFIRKSEIAVSQNNLLENRSNRYADYEQEENTKTYTIVCIDDSKAVVNAIKMYLNDNLFSVVGINDPLKALMQVIRLKPDMILLDITMPTLDGYELCSLLRKHSSLKETPIIMVTGKKGIINRVKAKMVKASDYITKPFQKKDLLKVMFKYIV